MHVIVPNFGQRFADRGMCFALSLPLWLANPTVGLHEHVKHFEQPSAVRRAHCQNDDSSESVESSWRDSGVQVLLV